MDPLSDFHRCGVATLMQLSGQLERQEKPSIYSFGIKATAGIQAIAFLLATLFAVLFGFRVTAYLGE
jgi:hypothetical protein